MKYLFDELEHISEERDIFVDFKHGIYTKEGKKKVFIDESQYEQYFDLKTLNIDDINNPQSVETAIKSTIDNLYTMLLASNPAGSKRHSKYFKKNFDMQNLMNDRQYDDVLILFETVLYSVYKQGLFTFKEGEFFYKGNNDLIILKEMF